MQARWQAQATLRKVAREQEEEEEDPDKVYKEEDDTGNGQRKGRGRGRGAKGRGRGRSGRGKKVEKTVEEEKKVEESKDTLSADPGDNTSPTSTVSKLPNEPMIALRRSQSKRRVLKRAKSNTCVAGNASKLKRLKSTSTLHVSPTSSTGISPESGKTDPPQSEVPVTNKPKKTAAKTKPTRRVSDKAGHNEENPPNAKPEGKRPKLEGEKKVEQDKKVAAVQDQHTTLLHAEFKTYITHIFLTQHHFMFKTVQPESIHKPCPFYVWLHVQASRKPTFKLWRSSQPAALSWHSLFRRLALGRWGLSICSMGLQRVQHNLDCRVASWSRSIRTNIIEYQN